MAIEQAVDLVSRMAQDPEYARTVHESARELDGRDLSDEEHAAVLADAATIVAMHDDEVAGFGLPLRTTGLPGFDTNRFAPIVIIGDPDGRSPSPSPSSGRG